MAASVFQYLFQIAGHLQPIYSQNRDSQYCYGQDPDGRVLEERADQRDRPSLGLAHGSTQPGQQVNHETSCKLEFVVLICMFNSLQTQISPLPSPPHSPHSPGDRQAPGGVGGEQDHAAEEQGHGVGGWRG